MRTQIYLITLLDLIIFQTPGADRFKIELKLIKKLLTDTDDKAFVEL